MSADVKSAKEPRVSCRVPAKLKRRLQKIALAYGIDESDVVRMALMSQLPSFEANGEQAQATTQPQPEAKAA